MESYLELLKVSELRQICKDCNIVGISKLRKTELIAIMKDCDLNGLVDTTPSAESPPPMPPIKEEEEEVILHLPNPPKETKSAKWMEMFKKGQEILDKKSNDII